MEVPVNKKNLNGTDRGLHIVIVNPISGIVEWTGVFDTYKSSAAFEWFCENTEIPDGYIIIAACKDDCSNNLSLVGREWF